MEIEHLIMTEQEKLIGQHPQVPHILGEWLTHVDQPTTTTKKHRKLEEINQLRQKAMENIAIWIIEHHIIERKIEVLERKSLLLQKYEFDRFVESLNLLPTIKETQKGNVAEIILIEYLKKKYRIFADYL
jgi:hypothetical protein